MDTLEDFDGLDPAALHPRLKKELASSAGQNKGEHYFKSCARLRERAKALLRAAFGIEHELFLLGNTTSALFAALLALERAGAQVVCRGEPWQHYPSYHALFLRPQTPKADGARWAFATHVSPLTGRVDALSTATGEHLLVDAAQSFGTNLTAELLLRADIFIAPLHKHVGLAVGQGVLGLRRDVPDHERLRALLLVAESGASHRGLLEQLLSAIEAADGRLYNKACISVDARLQLQALCDGAGLAILGEADSTAPFVCFTAKTGRPLATLLDPRRAHARYFRPENIVRFSFCHMARREEPAIDCSAELFEKLGGALLQG
jgi:hypothetical protein